MRNGARLAVALMLLAAAFAGGFVVRGTDSTQSDAVARSAHDPNELLVQLPSLLPRNRPAPFAPTIGQGLERPKTWHQSRCLPKLPPACVRVQ